MPVPHTVSEWFYVVGAFGAAAVGWHAFSWAVHRLLGMVPAAGAKK